MTVEVVCLCLVCYDCELYGSIYTGNKTLATMQIMQLCIRHKTNLGFLDSNSLSFECSKL